MTEKHRMEIENPEGTDLEKLTCETTVKETKSAIEATTQCTGEKQ